MIGDLQRCDRNGPNRFGIKGHYLARSGIVGDGGFANLNAFAASAISGSSGARVHGGARRENELLRWVLMYPLEVIADFFQP